MTDNDIIFGGEKALEKTLDFAASKNPEIIFVIPSCVPETIGDDSESVCKYHHYAEKIIYIPTSGFLNGKAKDGENLALITIAKTVKKSNTIPFTAALIGEKNLESEIEENYQEITRLLSLLGIRIIIRFCHNIGKDDLINLGKASLFICRDERVYNAGEEISSYFGRPLVKGYPTGLDGELQFLREVGAACEISPDIVENAVQLEMNIQNKMLSRFQELKGMEICIRDEPFEGTYAVAKEVMKRLGIIESPNGCIVKLPFYLPVGVAGIEKMLYLWRREKRKEGIGEKEK